MNYFYIVRHGQTENNLARRLSGWIDTPLTSQGLVPTDTVIAQLRDISFDAVYSSDLGRAFITAYVVVRGLELDKEIIRLPGLREVNYGDAANMVSAEAYKRYPLLDRDIDFVPPNGESLEHMQARLLVTIMELNTQHSDATILIVAHSGTMAALHSNFIGDDFGRHNISEEYAHDYIGRFTVADGAVTSFEKVA
jgi:2,3-bisphosphoglycerate-dependent phosphoglycerate mutase